MDNQGQGRARTFSNIHLRHRNANANAGSLLIIWSKQYRDEITEKRCFSFPTRHGTNEVLSPEEVETWMTASPDEALKLQRPLSNGSLKIVARGVKEDAAGQTT